MYTIINATKTAFTVAIGVLSAALYTGSAPQSASINLTNPSEYTYSDTYIEVSSGGAQVRTNSSWFDTDWSYRKPLILDNSSGPAQTNFQTSISVSYEPEMQPDFDDIRFTDSDASTEISYWIESKVDSSSATVWIDIPTIAAAASKQIYMYYGNPTTPSGSNRTDTFTAFDDFNRTDLNTGSIDWSKHPSNPLTSTNYGDPELYYEGGVFNLFAQDLSTKSIVRFTSNDGINFSNEGIVLAPGTGFEDDKVSDPTIVKIGSTYHMWYAGSTGASVSGFSIGHATSSDLSTWSKDPANPVFTGGGEGVNEPSVIYEPNDSGREYKMLYTKGTGTNDDIGNEDIGYAYSSDGTNWTDYGEVFTGRELQDQEQIKIDDTYYMFLNDIGGNILMSISADHVNWTIPMAIGLSPTALTFDSEAMWAPTIEDIGGMYYMYYQGTSGGGVQHRLGLVTGTMPDAMSWIASVNNSFSVDTNTIYKNNTAENSWHYALNTKAAVLPYVYETDLNFVNSLYGGYNYGIVVASDDNFLYTVIFSNSANTGAIYRTDRPVGSGSSDLLVDTNNSQSLTTGINYRLRTKVTATEITVDFYNGTAWIDDYLSYTGNFNNSLVGYFTYNESGGVSNFRGDDFSITKLASVDPTKTFSGVQSEIYFTNNPVITANNSVLFETLTNFDEVAIKNGGEVKYQFSNNGGSTWYWYSSGWQMTSNGYTQSNTAAELDANLASFPKGSGSFKFRAYLHSNGLDTVVLESINLGYTTADPESELDPDPESDPDPTSSLNGNRGQTGKSQQTGSDNGSEGKDDNENINEEPEITPSDPDDLTPSGSIDVSGEIEGDNESGGIIRDMIKYWYCTSLLVVLVSTLAWLSFRRRSSNKKK